ncbi:hypothetical protein RW1_035_01180 [Rhodococcus wratislaviensis NBRC 100605]|uniref:Uncharacterized protein n=1 Tax=Rhodococcus wratislaviensis NBRC 100605 TaxID=1219028 RepID=X0Q846_RHOWR|nr:hypothetical protein RW1_035_01180 [Rhodococcus wratislaviensis NBRC 100605]
MEVPCTKAVWAAQTPNTNCPNTIGVEEEFVLTDPITGHPALSNTADVAAAADMGVDLQRELPRAVHRYSPLRTPLPATFPGETVGPVLVEPEHEDYDAFEAQQLNELSISGSRICASQSAVSCANRSQ